MFSTMGPGALRINGFKMRMSSNSLYSKVYPTENDDVIGYTKLGLPKKKLHSDHVKRE